MRALVVAALMIAAQNGKSRGQAIIQSVNHYDLDVPGGFSFTKISPPMADFGLYEITRKGGKHGKLVLYFGNASEFPKFKWDRAPEVLEKDKKTTKEFPYSASKRWFEGLMSFDGITYRDTPASPFMEVHYFSDDASKADADDFKAIVKSIRVARAHIE